MPVDSPHIRRKIALILAYRRLIPMIKAAFPKPHHCLDLLAADDVMLDDLFRNMHLRSVDNIAGLPPDLQKPAREHIRYEVQGHEPHLDLRIPLHEALKPKTRPKELHFLLRPPTSPHYSPPL